MKLLDRFFLRTNRKNVLAWAFYDFANSSYVLIVVSFVFPIYFRDRIVAGDKADFIWGLIVSISILLGALLAPVVGAMTDHDGRRKSRFITYALLSIFASALLYFTGPGTVLFASLIFIAANLFFEVAQTLYDSFVGSVSTPETVGRISGFAWGFGYIGGVVAMLLLRPLFVNGFAGDMEVLYRLTFPLTALFFLIFSIPFFRTAKNAESFAETLPVIPLIKQAFSRLKKTAKNLKEYKNVGRLLLGLYFLNDGLLTLFVFMPIFARTTVGLEITEIFIMALAVQLLAFPTAIVFGWLSDRFGPKRILQLNIFIWIVSVILIYFTTTKEMLYVAALLAGIVFGATQSIPRSWLSQIVPEEKRYEFFGFNGFASKLAAILGPVLFGAIASSTGNQRYGILSLLPFFVIAFILFSGVKQKAGVEYVGE